MRKVYISLVLSLLVLVAQQGAILHELSHMASGASAETRGYVNYQAEKPCELCLAYSQLANPATGPAQVPLLFAPMISTADSQVTCAAIPADVLSPRSRGPPSLS